MNKKTVIIITKMVTRSEVRQIVQDEIQSDKIRSFWIKQLFGGNQPMTENKVKEIAGDLWKQNYPNFVTQKYLNETVSQLVTNDKLQCEIKSKIADLKLEIGNIVSNEASRILSHVSGLDELYKGYRFGITKDLDKHRTEVNQLMSRNIKDVTDKHKEMYEQYETRVMRTTDESVKHIAELGSDSRVMKTMETNLNKKLNDRLDLQESSFRAEMKQMQRSHSTQTAVVSILASLAGAAFGTAFMFVSLNK